MVKIRAKTVMKLSTGNVNLDYTYPAGADVDSLFVDVLHAVVQNKGTAGTKEYLEKLMADYLPDFKGIRDE